MNEMQQLEENTKRQKFLDTMEELTAYMDVLLDQMREQHQLHMRSAYLEMLTVATMVVVVIFQPDFWLPAFLLFQATMFRNWVMIYPQVQRAGYELDGILETLKILGMIDRDKTNKRKRKMKKYKVSWIEAAWQAAKEGWQSKTKLA